MHVCRVNFNKVSVSVVSVSDFIIHFGVRQGSVLSPFLFAIYLNDLSVFCKPEYNLYVILYADDILLLAPTLTSLERLLNEC